MMANDTVFPVMKGISPLCAICAFFDHLVDFAAGDYPALFSFASWLGLNLGCAAVSELYASLPPSPRFVTGTQ
jgi:hypothetical protein